MKVVSIVTMCALFVSLCEPVLAAQKKASDYFPLKEQAELAIAAEKGQTNKIAMMLRAGGDINAPGREGMTILLWCFLNQNKKGFHFLLEHGANPNAQMATNAEGLTADIALAGTSVMSFVSRHKDLWYLKEVLKYGGNPSLLNPVNTLTPIFEVSRSIRPDQINNMKVLIAAGAKLNDRDRDGHTPMMYAALNIRYDMVYTLLQAGADPSLKDNYGHTIVHFVNRIRSHIDPKGWEYGWYLKTIDILKSKGFDMEEGKKN